ncbi:MAG: hypothetical protein KGJ02_02620 [Verrucomicrobiota bacterium]|nr:hypothetical protein [Verrucomicrobiota bacterium]
MTGKINYTQPGAHKLAYANFYDENLTTSCTEKALHPFVLATRHLIQVAARQSLWGRVKHLGCGILECIPCVNCIVSTADHHFNVKNAIDTIAEMIDINQLPEYSEALPQTGVNDPRDSDEVGFPGDSVKEEMGSHMMMRGKDGKGNLVLLIKRPCINAMPFLIGVAVCTPGESLDVFYENGKCLYFAPNRYPELYNTSRTAISRVTAEQQMYTKSPGLKEFLEDFKKKQTLNSVLPAPVANLFQLPTTPGVNPPDLTNAVARDPYLSTAAYQIQ